ncbi:MAG TPA: hypothetical protein VEX68_19740 [Bryobacteraceae bacterium]|nr:hypothetical protein [Bryobacteraceae bacterium]
MRYLCFALLICAPLNAQSLSFGLKGGGLFTDPAERTDRSQRYVVGPALELGFGPRVAVEVNALYNRFGSASSSRVLRGHSIEFPLLGKFYFADRESAVRPYAASGFAFRNIWFDDGGAGGFARRVESTEPAVGAVVSGGITFKAWALKLSPEVRYTRWGGYNYPATNPNQVQALVGISF